MNGVQTVACRGDSVCRTRSLSSRSLLERFDGESSQNSSLQYSQRIYPKLFNKTGEAHINGIHRGHVDNRNTYGVCLVDSSDFDKDFSRELGSPNFQVLIMPPIWLRNHRWRMNALLLCIISLIGYLLFLDPLATVDIPENAIDIAEIEQELENGNPIHVVNEYKSPIDNRIFGETATGAMRDFQFESHLGKTYKYHQVWKWADQAISRNELFPEVKEIDDVLRAMQLARIVHVDVLDIGIYESGTSEKWVVTLEGGQKAMLKLVWDGEDVGGMKNHAQCNFGFEMPWAEIAAFHLHRVLGHRNTPYVTGRKINLRNEILPVASPTVAKQIQIKSGNETCVVGQCFHCDDKVIMCPPGGVVQASLAYWIPRSIKLWTYPPLYMPFSTPRMEEWGDKPLNYQRYCNKVRLQIAPYREESYFLDLMDFGVLDTLMYHYDSKHYTLDDESPAEGLTIRLDHGRSFCANDQDDEHVFLAPIHLCCKLRKSTWETMTRLRSGELSRKWRHSMAGDPLAPIMKEDWFTALDRRLKMIMNKVEECFKANGGMENVLV